MLPTLGRRTETANLHREIYSTDYIRYPLYATLCYVRGNPELRDAMLVDNIEPGGYRKRGVSIILRKREFGNFGAETTYSLLRRGLLRS